ncbi:MAG TPA: protoporphyrinogen oxidase [Terriglobales bacterium]|nr:protoporphyrinogen oxidase [Terriglobales bacterium]
MTKRIAVVGGGTAGLSAAYSLQKRKSAGAPIEFVVFEAGKLGGVIRTERIDDCVVEAGPDSFLTEKPWAADLCRELGLGDQLIASNDAERKTYMLVKGRLVPIPDGLMFMVPTKLLPAFLSPMFSLGTKARIVREWLSPPKPKTTEMTVADFVERHYGREMVDRVADPLLGGVYGGGADQLSVDAVLPRFVQMETKYGSLGRAMVAARKNSSSAAPRPLFTTLKSGMQQMTDALVSRIPKEVFRRGMRVEAVKPESGKWLVIHDSRTEEFDAVVIATAAHAVAALMSPQSELGAELIAIPYTSSMTVVLGYDQNVRTALPPGFGFLAPRIESRKILAATFVHNKFPHRAPENRAIIRCFIGGSVAEEMFEHNESDVATAVERELKSILGLNAAPLFTRVYKWRKAMAQYTVGHSARVDRIKSLVAKMPGLALAGNAYSGIGVPDCVRTGTEAAASVMTGLGFESPS